MFQQSIVAIAKIGLEYPLSLERAKQGSEKLEAIISVKLEK
jgi:hypothetical protein